MVALNIYTYIFTKLDRRNTKFRRTSKKLSSLADIFIQDLV